MAYKSTHEIEHRYLLSGVPKNLMRHSHSVIDVRHVYLATDNIQERFSRRKYLKDRSKVEGHKVYRRTVKIGHGLDRLEFKDVTTKALYKEMRDLSHASHLHKVRHRRAQPIVEVTDFAEAIQEDYGITDFVWEVDTFVDRELFLAEVEVPWPGCPVKPPDWLAPHIVREVTDELQYEGVALAK